MVRVKGNWSYRVRRVLRAGTERFGWRGQSRAAVADGFEPARGPVLVIAPHPDDEVVGCGGTIARHARAGDTVCVLYLTRGEKSVGYPWLTASQKRERREKEARDSSAILGVHELLFLDGLDGALDTPAETQRLSQHVAGVLARLQPRLVYVPHPADKHVDHRMPGRMIGALCPLMPTPPRVIEYELWSPLEAEYAVDVTAEMTRKLRAIRCHALAMDAFDYVPTILGLAAYRSGTLLQRKGYAEAFRRAVPPESGGGAGQG